MPEICAINNEQGEALVESVSNVLAQYKIKPNPKMACWLTLAGTLGIIYVPKVLAVREVLAIRRANNPPRQRMPVNPSPVPVVQSIDPTGNAQPPMVFG